MRSSKGSSVSGGALRRAMLRCSCNCRRIGGPVRLETAPGRDGWSDLLIVGRVAGHDARGIAAPCGPFSPPAPTESAETGPHPMCTGGRNECEDWGMPQRIDSGAGALDPSLRASIERSGYYPALVAEAV